MAHQRTVQVDTLQPSGAETADGTGAGRFNTKTAQMLEMWVNITAVAGASPTADFILEASIDGINFTEIARISSVTIVSQVVTAVSRDGAPNDPLGTSVRVRWEIGGTSPSFTFDVKLVRQE